MSPEQRQKAISTLLQNPPDLGMLRKRIIERNRSEEQKAKVRAAWNRLSPEERRARTAPGTRASRVANPSSLELRVQEWLDLIGSPYERQVRIGIYMVDFLLSNSWVLEVDGEYWHGLPGRVEQDSERDNWLGNQGYSILRMPESVVEVVC